MPDLRLDIQIWNNSDEDRPVEFEISDRSSSVRLLKFTLTKAELLAALAGSHRPDVPGWLAPPDVLAHAGKVMLIATRDLPRETIRDARGSLSVNATIRTAAMLDLAQRGETDYWHEVQPNNTNHGPTYTVRRYVTEEEASQPLPDGVRRTTRI